MPLLEGLRVIVRYYRAGVELESLEKRTSLRSLATLNCPHYNVFHRNDTYYVLFGVHYSFRSFLTAPDPGIRFLLGWGGSASPPVVDVAIKKWLN
jgi:hypothetical protein